MDFYINVNKSVLNKGKLVKKPVQVKGKNGKIFTRMQWVDPKTGQPVIEHHGGEDDYEKHKLSKLNQVDKLKLANRYLSRDPERARAFAKHSNGGFLNDNVHNSELTSYVANRLHDVPLDHLKPHMNGIGDPVRPLGLEHTKDLTKEERAKKYGTGGSLDTSKLNKGTLPYEHEWFEDEFSYHKKGTRFASRSYHYVFGDTTVEGLESAFSHPDDEFKAILQDLNFDANDEDNTFLASFSLFDEEGYHTYRQLARSMGRHRIDERKYRIGEIHRVIKRDEDGQLHVDNSEFEIEPDYQSKGYGQHIYERSEQLWRHLAQGHPVNISLIANISIGVYAWAKKGYDFESTSRLYKAHDELKKFCSENGFDLNDVLKFNGYNNISDITHAWQFATLKYGNDDYDLKALAPDRYKDEIHGEGHFGKAFMMGGMRGWKGHKILNAGSNHEKVHDIHHKYNR